jgi:glycosyltransferase involved in cell wall biosynthesis
VYGPNTRISVIMSAYNAAEFIREAVESILKQTYPYFEFLILDDASTDDTLGILESYTDQRMRIFSNAERKGLTKNLNFLINFSKGDFIARMDADDIAMPERFYKQLSYMKMYPEAVAIGSACEIFGDREGYYRPAKTHDEIFTRLLLGTPISHPTAFMRRRFLEKVKYEETLTYSQDYKLWFELGKLGKLGNIEDVLLKYRAHDKNISEERKTEQLNFKKQIQLEIWNYFTGSKLKNETIISSIAFLKQEYDKIESFSEIDHTFGQILSNRDLKEIIRHRALRKFLGNAFLRALKKSTLIKHPLKSVLFRQASIKQQIVCLLHLYKKNGK